MIDFQDRPDFRPCYTPIQMFSAGIFGGGYFQITTTLPEQFTADMDAEGIRPQHIFRGSGSNAYKTAGGASLEWWQEKGLIHPDDPNGWVEWYIKFYYGRRHEDDSRQIKRFRSFVARHMGMLRSYQSKGKNSAKTKQNLLQWAWNHEIDPAW